MGDDGDLFAEIYEMGRRDPIGRIAHLTAESLAQVVPNTAQTAKAMTNLRVALDVSQLTRAINDLQQTLAALPGGWLTQSRGPFVIYEEPDLFD